MTSQTFSRVIHHSIIVGRDRASREYDTASPLVSHTIIGAHNQRIFNQASKMNRKKYNLETPNFNNELPKNEA